MLGDSNTKNVKFGLERGTLGSWMPGKGVKVGHIEAIPDAADIGPYRNIIIHTGINSINNPKYRKSNRYLIKILEEKCKDICELYPRCKIFVSLLLPTRSKSLNYQVREFNNLLLEMTYSYRNISVIDHAVFGDVLTNEHGRWNADEERHDTNDALHLGKKGIRLFAAKLKSAVMEKGKNQSRTRFDGGGGHYRNAVERGAGHRDGYQPPLR